MTKKSRRAIAAAMLPPKPPPPKVDVRPEQLPAAVASYHFLTDPEIKAAREIVEYWISHVDGKDSLNGITLEMARQVAAVLDEAGLTDRQSQVMDLLGDGHTEYAVADTLDLSRSTVKTHKRRAVAKLREALVGAR